MQLKTRKIKGNQLAKRNFNKIVSIVISLLINVKA